MHVHVQSDCTYSMDTRNVAAFQLVEVRAGYVCNNTNLCLHVRRIRRPSSAAVTLPKGVFSDWMLTALELK